MRRGAFVITRTEFIRKLIACVPFIEDEEDRKKLNQTIDGLHLISDDEFELPAMVNPVFIAQVEALYATVVRN
jgi:hypothetical protein